VLLFNSNSATAFSSCTQAGVLFPSSMPTAVDWTPPTSGLAAGTAGEFSPHILKLKVANMVFRSCIKLELMLATLVRTAIQKGRTAAGEMNGCP